MARVLFTFVGEINDLLASDKKGITFVYEFKEHPAIKDPIEALGVPHTEVGGIEVNNVGVDFSYKLQDGDRIIVYPYDILSNNTKLIPLQPPLPVPIRFILDVHLGKLTSFLRLLGFDSLYRNDYQDPELADISVQQERIILTRDRGLLRRKQVVYGYYIRSNQPRQQIVEVLQRFQLKQYVHPWQRCIPCNGKLESVAKQVISQQLPEKTRQQFNHFYRCRDCGQIYWQGAHYQEMETFIHQLLS